MRRKREREREREGGGRGRDGETGKGKELEGDKPCRAVRWKTGLLQSLPSELKGKELEGEQGVEGTTFGRKKQASLMSWNHGVKIFTDKASHHGYSDCWHGHH
jgi:hypothetical protein